MPWPNRPRSMDVLPNSCGHLPAGDREEFELCEAGLMGGGREGLGVEELRWKEKRTEKVRGDT